LQLASKVMVCIGNDTISVDREIIFAPRFAILDLVKMTMEIRETAQQAQYRGHS